MNSLDIFIIAIISFNALIGLKKGFVRMLFDLASLFGSIIIAIKQYAILKDIILRFIELDPRYTGIVSFVVIVVVVYTMFSLVSRFFDHMVSLSGLGFFNRILGVAFGTFKGALFVLPFLIPMIMFQFKPLQDSILIKPVLPYIKNLIDSKLPNPSDLSNSLPSTKNTLKENTNSLNKNVNLQNITNLPFIKNLPDSIPEF